jgi:GT2 family glycosyltransferase
MAVVVSAASRVSVDGKFFRLGGEKFYPKGVCYGPFAPNGQSEPFCSPEQTAADFAQMRALGANVVRVYELPPPWFLDLAAANDLRLLIDVAWNKHACFGDSAPTREAARKAVRQAAEACYRHPAVFALSVVNEVPPDIVRWSGAAAVEEFIDELVRVAKAVDPERLCTFGNYPPTEYLHPKETDFVCFNVYLHQAKAFRNYLQRLQMQADTKPLVLGECGVDSVHEGEWRQAELLASHVETAFRQGLAGVVVYSWTDEWFKDGRPVEEWHFGLSTRARQPKPAFAAVQNQFRAAPYYPPPRCPKVSVVVACYNGARTLKLCLEALARLRYPDYEVILVDDGSSDATPQIAGQYSAVRCLCQPHQGLAVARNTGIAAAKGEIVAFTDSDCRPDEDWLHYLVGDLLHSNFAGIGGHNLLPADDSAVAGAVMVSPGGPAHVMLTDRVAEHIPGCNMAFWKWALLEVGCFDPAFHQAGDDVDLCWRLQQRGYQLGFSPAGFVWHYRRSTVGAYLKQQRGYGEAEALLERKHPEYFNPLGGSVWRGRIYAAAHVGLLTRRPIVYHGLFGGGLFQSLYTAPPMLALMLLTSLEYHVLVNLPLLVLAVMFRWLIPVALASVLISVGTCVAAAAQAQVPKKKRRFWSRPLVAALFALQPIVRGWARYRGRLFVRQAPLSAHENLDSLSRKQQGRAEAELRYRVKPGFARAQFLEQVQAQLERHGWQFRADTGWSDFDVEVHGSRWSRLQLTTVSETTLDGQRVLRCRLRTAWSLPARLVFWGALGLELLVIGLVGRGNPWLWLLLLTLPAWAWWVRRNQRDLRRLIGVFLDELGKGLDLQKLEQ